MGVELHAQHNSTQISEGSPSKVFESFTLQCLKAVSIDKYCITSEEKHYLGLSYTHVFITLHLTNCGKTSTRPNLCATNKGVERRIS